MHGYRKDGGNWIVNGTYSGNVVSFTLPRAAMAIEGAGIADVVFTTGNEVVGSANFCLLVERATFPNGVTYSNDSSVFQDLLDFVNSNAIPEAISDWLEENITATSPAVDASLSVQGAAADAKATGDALTNRVVTQASITGNVVSFKNANDSEKFTLDLSALDDIKVVTSMNQMTDHSAVYMYTWTEGTEIHNQLYFYNGEWIPLGAGVLNAPTADSMTNISAIYKYTGSESGYITNGLYYYNGTSFVLVDAPIETDKTLTEKNVPADAKTVGQALDDLTPDTQLVYANRPAEAKATGTAIRELLGRFDEIEPYIDRIKEMIVAEDTDFDVSSLPDYWEDAVRNALVYTTALGDDYVHHLFTTDNHYDTNQKKSVDIQQLLWATDMYSKVICLGDITDSHSQTEADHVIADYEDYGDDFLLAIGNHDDFNSDSSILLPLIEDNENLQGNDVQHFNYYLDDDENKIRYIVHNAPKSSDFSDKVALVTGAPSGYHCMILSHYPAYEYLSEFSDPPAQAWNAMGDDGLFTSVLLDDNPFIGFFCGHEHIDYHVDRLGAGIVHQMALSNDACSSVKDAVHYQKTVGTDTEQAITIVSVNTAKQKVKLYRIGMPTTYGRRWEYSYKKEASAPTIKQIYLGGNGNIQAGTKAQFAYFPALNNDKDYYLVNNGNTTVYWEYRLDYLSGAYVYRYSYGWTFSPFAKVNARKIVRPSTQSSDQFLFGFETQETTGSLDDFELVTSLDQYDFGYDFDEVPWYDGKWYDGNLVSNTGYAASDLIKVREGETYQFSVDISGWSTQYLHIAAITDDGFLNSSLVRKSNSSTSSASFTIPEGIRYIVISSDQLSGNTDKVQLVQTS